MTNYSSESGRSSTAMQQDHLFPMLKDTLRSLVPPAKYDVWIRRLHVVTWIQGHLVIGVPNRFYYEWHMAHYQTLIAEQAAQLTGGAVRVTFQIVPDAQIVTNDTAEASSSTPSGDHAASADSNAVSEASPSEPQTPESHDSAAQNNRAAGEGVAQEKGSLSVEDAGGVTARRTISLPGESGLTARQARDDSYVPRPFSDSPYEAGTASLDKRYSFENFVVGPSNNMAYASAKAVADNPGRAYNPLFLHSSVGLGKTHLLHAICNEFVVRRPGERICMMSCEELTNEFVRSVQRNDHERFRDRFRNVHLLVIDDIHFLQGKERTQEEFFHTFNHLYKLKRQIVLSSDAAPREIPDLEDRLMSRFQWGLVTKLERPETETRMAIVRRKASLYGIDVPPDVEELIAANFRNNIRELEGALQSIRAHADILQCSITMELAKKALSTSLRNARQGVTLDDITSLICEQYHVRVSDLRSKRRGRSISRPRQIIMFLARKLTRLSLEEIGDHFGGRDHSTVLYAVRTVDRERNKNPEFASDLARLEDLLA